MVEGVIIGTIFFVVAMIVHVVRAQARIERARAQHKPAPRISGIAGQQVTTIYTISHR